MIFQIPHSKNKQFSSLLSWHITFIFMFQKKLVGGLEHFLFSHKLGMSSCQLTFIFFRGVGFNHQPENHSRSSPILRWFWEICALVIGFLGPTPLAAHVATINLVALLFMPSVWPGEMSGAGGLEHVSLGIRWWLVWGFWATLLVGSVEHVFYSIYWELLYPNWLSLIFFQRVRYTTNQLGLNGRVLGNQVISWWWKLWKCWGFLLVQLSVEPTMWDENWWI